MAKRPVRLKRKMEIIERVLKGETPAEVASDEGIDEALVAKWHDAFIKAGRNALRYTMDEGEIPTIDDIERTAQRAFPLQLMHECDSAACFFCAQFFGKNDVIHIHKAGIPEVTVVDLDAEKLEIMRALYPQHWNLIAEDAFDAANRFAAEGRKFDVVTCDPYSSLAPTVALDRLDEFLAIARRYLMQFYTQDTLQRLGATPDANSVGERLSEHMKRPMKVKDFIHRSSHAGGVYWCVIEL